MAHVPILDRLLVIRGWCEPWPCDTPRPVHPPWLAKPPDLAGAELVCLAVAQVLLRFDEERHRLRAPTGRVGQLLPRLLGQSAYNQRLKAAAPPMEAALLRPGQTRMQCADIRQCPDMPLGTLAISRAPRDSTTARTRLAGTVCMSMGAGNPNARHCSQRISDRGA